ncbi:MAG: hypothetical protein AB7K71_29780 [Polyangiaceae bacterium]
MRQLNYFGLFLLLALPIACDGSSADSSSSGNGGTAGAAGSAGSNAGGAAGAAGETSYEALNVCAQAPSYPATASFADDGNGLSLDAFDFLLRALKSRTPGKYSFTRNTQDGGGSGAHHDVMIITDDGTVFHASKHVVNTYTTDPPENIDETTPVQRCTPKPESYFQDCLDALAADPQGNAIAECAQVYADWKTLPLPFFESCEPAGYACEPTDMQKLLACGQPDIHAWMDSGERAAEGVVRTRRLLEAFRDRTPGSYRYDATQDITYSWGGETRALLSDADPDFVLTAADGVYYGESDSAPFSEDAMRCKLQPADYFQSCIDELDAGTGFNKPECVHFGNTPLFPWFESCEPASPTCK